MDHLKEQLKAHYDKTEFPEGLRQKLLTLEVPESTPVPVRVNRKRLLTPIAAMLMAAVAILGGGKCLMNAMPLTAIPPESAPTEVVPIESAADFEDVAPTDVETDPAQDIMPTAPAEPEPSSTDKPAPEKTAPEQNCPSVTTPQSPPPAAPSNPAPPPDNIPDPMPPMESEGSEDDVPPNDPGEGNAGSSDDPPTEPGAADPVDPPVDDPVDPPVDPVDPPIDLPDNPVDPPDNPPDYLPNDPPINPEPPSMEIPEISGHYEYKNGQHIVYLTNCDTGEISTLNLTSLVTADGYHGTHDLFGYTVEVSLIQSSSDAVPTAGYVFKVVVGVIM